MFNTYHAGNYTSNIKVNAVTGAILKNHPKSWFERFSLKSKRAEDILRENGHHAQRTVYDESYRYERKENVPDKDIIVLQMVICGDMEVLAELVYRKDYEINECGRKNPECWL